MAAPGTLGLGDLVRSHLGNRATTVHRRKDDWLCREGEPAAHLWLVESGLVAAVVTDPSGKQLLLAIRGAGDVVGELAAIDGRPRSASLVALSDLEVHQIRTEDFREALTRTPSLSIAVLQLVVRRLRDADRRRVDQVVESTSTRVCRNLLALGAQHVRAGGRIDQLDVPVSQETLAGLIGASREATSKALAELRRDGLVETGRGRVRLVDLDGLRVAAGL